MKKILSTFLLSAMLVLALGGCESEEEYEDWDELSERIRLERIESDIKELHDQVYVIVCELKWRLALDGQWRHSPFKDEAEYNRWALDGKPFRSC